MTLVKSFLETCRNYAEKTAIIDSNGSITYDELRRNALCYLTWLLKADTGNDVGILLPNCKEFAAAFYGILMAGKIPVPLNFLLSPEQLHYVIRDAEIGTFITNNHFKPFLGREAQHILCVEETDVPPSDEGNIRSDDEDALAAMLYTSGTQSNPKGVMLTHKNFLSNLNGCLDAFHFNERDILIGVLPLFHTYALTTCMVLPVKVGATAVYLPRFSGSKVLETVERYKVTSLFAIPSMYRVLLRTAETSSHDLSTLRLCTSGGELLPNDLLEEFNRTFPVPLTEGYGLTEATAIVSVNLPEKYKAGSIGPPLCNVEVKIVDDNGIEVPVCHTGEIWVKGPNVMKGYYKLPRETAETITPEGWLKTGDYGRFDNEGFLWITGRKKEMIIVSGENVSPNEIEHVISEYVKVFEVAVIGVPDSLRGEVPKAFIVLHDNMTCSEEEIKRHISQRLPHYKIPKYFEFRKDLPHGPTGKILKKALK